MRHEKKGFEITIGQITYEGYATISYHPAKWETIDPTDQIDAVIVGLELEHPIIAIKGDEDYIVEDEKEFEMIENWLDAEELLDS